MIMLTGEMLLATIREASEKASKLDLMRACGYTSINPDGSEELLAEAFYEAIVTANGGDVESEEEEATDLLEDWIYLLGGQDEVDKTIEYGVMSASPTLDRLQDAVDDRACIVALAKLRREYEKDTKRKAIETNPEVFGINPFTIADHGIQIFTVTDDDDSSKVLFSYTVGNEFSEESHPDLLTFCKSISTIDKILNGLSAAMADSMLEIKSGEVVEVAQRMNQGIVKVARLHILSGETLEICQDRYACAVRPGYPIAIVDLADQYGLFPGDEGYDSEESMYRSDFIPFPGSPSKHIILTSDNRFKIECAIDLSEPEFTQFSRARVDDSLKAPIPELFSFYPSAKNILTVFTSVRKLLESHKLSIEPEMVFEVDGILGLLGEVPIRLSLLSRNQLERASEYFGAAKHPTSAIILVDIPDARGNFAWEEGAQDYVARNFDRNFMPDNSAPITKISMDNNFPVPSSSTALYDCLSCYIGFLENPECDADDDETSTPPSLATMRVLLNLLAELHPDIWDYEGSPDEVDKAHVSFCQDISKTYLVPKLALEWVKNARLIEYEETSPDPYEADIWRLPPPSEIPLPIADQFPSVSEWGDYYPDKNSFLNDVDWMEVKRTLEAAYADSIDPDEVEICKRVNPCSA